MVSLAGSDNILNEYIKYTLDDMLAIYVLLFNVILDKGIIPESWTEGNMIYCYYHYQYLYLDF
jgi:hypothetical protein